MLAGLQQQSSFKLPSGSESCQISVVEISSWKAVKKKKKKRRLSVCRDCSQRAKTVQLIYPSGTFNFSYYSHPNPQTNNAAGQVMRKSNVVVFFFVVGINDCQHVLIDWNNVLSAKRTLHEKVEAGKSDI